MNTTSLGRQAEAAVAKYLEDQGYKIIDQNWRTRRCEIDIVAQKDDTAYFVEVKYRVSDNQGSGFEYITPTKLKQLVFAAGVWVAANHWDGDWQLMAASVAGDKFELIELVEIN